MMHAAVSFLSRRSVVGVLLVGLLVSPGAGALAQSAVPGSSAPPSSAVPGSAAPSASPCVAASGECLASPAPFSWPPVQFLGGRGDPITSSTCGVPGVDTFHLVSTNEITVDEFDVSLEPYDPAFLGGGWPGTVQGTITGLYDVVPCYDKAVAVYDPATGVFELGACLSVSVPMSAC